MARSVYGPNDPLVELYKRLKVSGATDQMMRRLVRRLVDAGIDYKNL